jgi:hypothetical protein
VEFDGDVSQRMKNAQDTDGFRSISRDLSGHIEPYDPSTWRSPADAMARCFYRWSVDDRDR